MASRKYPRNAIEPAAERMIEVLSPAVMRIETAGSLRRGEKWIGDIDIVVIPRPYRPQFGEDPNKLPANALEVLLSSMLESERIEYRINVNSSLWKWGPRYKQFKILDREGRPLDFAFNLHCVLPPAQWGSKMVIHTGPTEFNKELMRLLSRFRPDLKQDQGALWKRIQRFKNNIPIEDWIPIDTPEEADYFTALGLPFISPANRYVVSLRKLWYARLGDNDSD